MNGLTITCFFNLCVITSKTDIFILIWANILFLISNYVVPYEIILSNKNKILFAWCCLCPFIHDRTVGQLMINTHKTYSKTCINFRLLMPLKEPKICWRHWFVPRKSSHTVIQNTSSIMIPRVSLIISHVKRCVGKSARGTAKRCTQIV